MKRWWNDDALMWTERGHVLDRDGLRKMRAYPGDGFGNPLDAGLRVANLRDTSADGRAQQTNQDLVDDEWSEEIRIFRVGHQFE